jgi:hypothetical protein
VRSEVQVLLDPPILGLPRIGMRGSVLLAKRMRHPVVSLQRGLSSAGRAPDLHSGGQEFDPPRLHQFTRCAKAAGAK